MQNIADVNISTLSHATELAAKVIHKVAGEAVATTVNGEILNNTQIKHAVVAKMQGCFITGEGGKK